MIDLASLAKLAGATGTSTLATIGAAYLLFTPKDEFIRFVAQNRTGTILELVEKLKGTDMPPDIRALLCNTLESEIIQLCTEDGNHPFCKRESMESLKREAGC